MANNKEQNGPKILLLDIETAPILAYVWNIWEQNIPLNMIVEDWSILSWAAKWADDAKIMHMDQRAGKSNENEKKLLKGMWELLDQADFVITQNGNSFDVKKLNAKFIKHKFQPPSSYKQIDTKLIAKKYFAFTSNKLEYMAKDLDLEDKKSDHKDFPGFMLWQECLHGNQKAWKEMEKYNKQDVLSLEKLYNRFRAWDNSINPNLYVDELDLKCSCGSETFKRNGYTYTPAGRYQRFKCKDCGAESRGRTNLFDKDKKASLKLKTTR